MKPNLPGNGTFGESAKPSPSAPRPPCTVPKPTQLPTISPPPSLDRSTILKVPPPSEAEDKSSALRPFHFLPPVELLQVQSTSKPEDRCKAFGYLIVNHTLGVALPAHCNDRSCPMCAEFHARREYEKLCVVPNVDYHVVLTLNPGHFRNQYTADRALYHRFTKFVKRVRRRIGCFQFYGHVRWQEETDFPHLHLLVISPPLSKEWL